MEVEELLKNQFVLWREIAYVFSQPAASASVETHCKTLGSSWTWILSVCLLSAVHFGAGNLPAQMTELAAVDQLVRKTFSLI